MIYNSSTILFLIGLLILMIPYIIILCKKEDVVYETFILCIIIIAITMPLIKKDRENYEYNYALQTGKLVGGVVYSSYPSYTPGLGWI